VEESPVVRYGNYELALIMYFVSENDFMRCYTYFSISKHQLKGALSRNVTSGGLTVAEGQHHTRVTTKRVRGGGVR